MIALDQALAERAANGDPIRVGLIGAGALGSDLIRSLAGSIPGIRLAAIAARRPGQAIEALGRVGLTDPLVAGDQLGLEMAIRASRPVVTEDARLVCTADGIDAIIDATGSIPFGAEIALAALERGRPVYTNAELEGTLGPILRSIAERHGTIFSAIDGDQPGVEVRLYRSLVAMGLEPLLCGNIKGFLDRRRTPDTQLTFAGQWGLDPYKAAGFADGTKMAFEQAVVANAVGFRVARRGMVGLAHEGPVAELVDSFDVEELRAMGGIVDYALGASPAPGIFILAASDPREARAMDFLKLGSGPLYPFVVAQHMPHLEAPLGVARGVLYKDPVTVAAGPTVDVISVAKRDLRAGETLDDLGGFTTYGECENADVVDVEQLLPIGLAMGCRMRRDVAMGTAIRRDDIEIPPGRLIDRLRAEQDASSRSLATSATEPALRSTRR